MLVALIIILAFSIKFYAFQTYMAQLLASYMSAELNAKIQIERLEIDLLKRVELKGLLVMDLKEDTILYAPSMKCVLQNYSVRKRFIRLNEISLQNPRIKIAKYKGEKDLNFEFITDYFDDGKKSTKKSKPWKVSCARIKVQKANFSLNNYNKSYRKFGIDFDHLGVYPLNVSLSEFTNYGDTSTCLVKNLSLREKSGFVIDTMNTRLKIAPKLIALTPLRIKTPFSLIKSPYFSFHFNDFEDFDDFEPKVRMTTYISASNLNLGDLSYFASELRYSNQEILLNGKFDGTVDDFEATNFTFAYSPRTLLRGNFKIKDITHAKNAFFDLDIKKLKASGIELANFKVPPYDDNSYLDLGSEGRALGDIEYAGTFIGTLDDFKSKGSLNSSIGLANIDLKYKRDSKTDFYKMSGNIASKDFDVGKLLREPDVGKVTSDVVIDISGKDFKKSMNVTVKAAIESIEYNNYAYTNCTVEGKVRNETFVGNFKIRDDNIYLDYNGYINYGKKIPEYDFTARVYNAAITKLNFGDRDESATISFKIKTTARGLKLDDLRGRVDLFDVAFCENNKDYDFKDINLTAEEFADSTKKITLTSELISGKVEGLFNFNELPIVFISVLSKAVPSLFDNRIVKLTTHENFSYKFEIHDFTKIQQLFIPELELSKNIVLDGKFNSETNVFRFSGKNIRKLKYNDQYFENLKFVSKNVDDYLETNIEAGNFQLNDSIQLQNFELSNQVYNNKTAAQIVWDNTKSGNLGRVNIEGNILSHNHFVFTIMDSSLVKIKQGAWINPNKATISIDSTTIAISEFDAYSKQQSISINGLISKNPNDQLVASLCNFKLETITPLLLGSDLEFRGDINGNIVVSNVYTKPDFVNSVAIDSFFVNNQWVGDVEATNYYEKGSDKIVTVGEISRKGIPNLKINGSYFLEKKQNSLDYKFAFNETNLGFINGFLPSDVSNFQGLADGEIKLTGTPDEPLFNGKLKLHNGGVKITMLNTSYFLEDGEIEIFPDMIALNRLTIQDVRGNGGKVNGTYNHTNFTNGNYAFDLDFTKMLCLNTTEEMNEIYYGKAYASGIASIQGYGDKIDVIIDAKTEKNTKLTMPMYGVSDITIGDFVVFESNDSSSVDKQIDLEGITMTFDFKVTPDAEINLVFDKLSGAQLKARGNGPIKMEITPLGEFLMTGVYEVEDPSTYKLAMMSVINKNFVVAKGGTIKWFGDPMNAEIDITAVYKLKASVYDIMPVDIQSSYRKNVDVNVDIQLKNSLFKPDFVFDINIPKADENVRSALATVKNTNEELFRQTMSLLIINKFMTPSNAIGTSANAGSGAANYTSELVTNQLNSLLSQISKDVDIGVNYKPGDEISNQEIAVALSTQALNGRINISTNVGVSNSTTNQNQSSLIGDFNIEYLLTEDGNVRVRGYNESNDFDITNSQQAPYTQGVAIFYQKDFDNSKELKLLQRFFNIFRSKEKDWKPDPKEKELKKQRKEQLKKEKEEDNKSEGEEKG
jgi:hypothetical protein